MADAGHDFADSKIAEFQAEVWEVYQSAQADAQEALSKFLKKFEKEDAKRRKQVEDGELSKAEYADWRRGQMLRSKQLSATLDQVSEAMTNANQVAMAALSGKLPEVYAENANFAAYGVCKETGLALSFDLVDADAVQGMLTAGEAAIVAPAVKVAKDKAWNRKLMASQLTQGILLGESIPKMARRVQRVTGANYAAAVRIARTTATGAENAGRVSSYKRAAEMGVKLKKEWVATLDNRTRHSHRQLDQTKVPNGEKFPNGCRFPGDPQGPGAEVHNCRCTLVAAIDGIDTSDAERFSRLPEGMTYEQWKASDAVRKPYSSAGRTMGEFFAQPSVKKQLEKAGMSEAQARKVLSAEMKRQGKTGSQFRTMQKSSQVEYWRNAMANDGMGPLGGTMPRGLSEDPRTREMAKGMAEILRKSEDERIKAMFAKFGPKLRAVQQSDEIAHFSPSRIRVEMNIREAMKGNYLYAPYQTVFHEFGHMIDWLASDGASFRSGKTRIAEAIDADWRKLQRDVLVKEATELGKKDPRRVIADMRSFAREIGNDSMVDLAHDARRAVMHEGATFDELMKREAFRNAVEAMCDADLNNRRGYNATRASRTIIDGLKPKADSEGLIKWGDVSDVIQGASGIHDTLGFGHDVGYFDGDLGRENAATEFFAEACSARMTNKESLALLRKMFPSAMREFEKLVEEVSK